MELDSNAVVWLNELFRFSAPILQRIAVSVINYHLVKGVVVIFMLWWALRNRQDRLIDDDLFLIKTIAATVLMLGIARAMQNWLPARARPLHEESVEFEPLLYQHAETLQGWSSFPSDHAVLFAGLATAIWLADRRVGAAAAAWVVLVICLPRVVLGLHYPSDLLAGAAMGIFIMLAVQMLRAPIWLSSRLKRLEDRHAGILYGLAFVYSYLCASLFDDARAILGGLANFISL